ncbi:hypothetical protein FZW96_13505 [Bacillus sp. BGMRC 2118]|nr:hypothetical protein FZW96_13505 [Bacillus sp. BGMRC 2118]
MKLEVTNKKMDVLLRFLISCVIIFCIFQWNKMRTEVKETELRNEWQTEASLKEIATIFFQIDTTLKQYEFPINQEVKNYFQDSLKKDYHHFHYHWHSVHSNTEDPYIRTTIEEYSIEIESVLKQLSGMEYTEEEKKLAMEAFHSASEELYTLIEHQDFNLENVKDKEGLIKLFKQLAKRLEVLDRM